MPHRLTPDQVAAIREAEGSSYAVAWRLGVSQSAVVRVRRGETYRQAPGPSEVRMDLLESLGRVGAMSVRDLVEDTGRETSAVHAVLMRLLRDGLVRRRARQQTPSRRRVWIYRLAR